jgi:uncharacterized protein YdiU (UPF0061 family)
VPNPFLSLPFEPALESLGTEFYDPVEAASFPLHRLRFRNDALLPILGLDPQTVKDEDFVECFGLFEGIRPFLALRYHGRQIGGYSQIYNPDLGDGRGFLYGQVRGTDGYLYDFGTKGSGQTPYSRRGDGRLTLKGGVREVLAAEALQGLGVTTSRCLSLVETGEDLWRGDEPSPTRSAVMVRFSRSHIRFGTFERLAYLGRPDLITALLEHVIELYYPDLDLSQEERREVYQQWYRQLVGRVARLAAQWMTAGFCHGVLNTDNMSITGESFDYGPYGFIPAYNPRFVAAYFDSEGLYSFGNQPAICRLNLDHLRQALAPVIPPEQSAPALEAFDEEYRDAYQTLLLARLGFGPKISSELGGKLFGQTLLCLAQSQTNYPQFFSHLTQDFNPSWRQNPAFILENQDLGNGDWNDWRALYHQALGEVPADELTQMPQRLRAKNPATSLLRPEIERVWAAIDQGDDWEPFNDLVRRLQAPEPSAVSAPKI